MFFTTVTPHDRKRDNAVIFVDNNMKMGKSPLNIIGSNADKTNSTNWPIAKYSLEGVSQLTPWFMQMRQFFLFARCVCVYVCVCFGRPVCTVYCIVK